MNICKALLKHGSSNFSLTIIEYCSPDKCLIREKHYWDLFKPEYNIAQDPTAPFSGRQHSDESKIIMSEANKGENNPMFGKNNSDDSKKIMSEANKGEKNPMFGKTGKNHPMHGKPRPSGAGKPSQQIEVTDSELNQTTTYNSMSEAGRACNLPSYRIIANYIKNNQKKPYKGRYTFKRAQKN